MSSNLELYHNKKEQDAVNRAYHHGCFHTLGQLDQGNNNHEPPSDLDGKEACDEGWKAAENS